MNRVKLKYILLVLFISSVALSCKITRPYQQPAINANALYRDQTTTDTATIATMPWQNLFTAVSVTGQPNPGYSR